MKKDLGRFKMGKATQWESQIDGKSYAFTHEKIKGKHIITANGAQSEIKGGFMSTMLGFDEGFTLDGREARLVIERNKPDVVVGGVYLQSGKQYVKRPAWVLAFAIICILIPIVSLGGALPALLGFAGAAICVSVSKSSLPAAARVALCVVITLLAWILWFVLLVGVSMLQ